MYLKPHDPQLDSARESADLCGEAGALDVEITPAMIETGLKAAMDRLYKYDVAWEYVDRDMMRGIILAALVGVFGASQKVKFSRHIEHQNDDIRHI
jgi:hypothetical protein